MTKFPKNRLDALGDGIFAVAMTLLILDLRLPEDFAPRDAAEMWQGLVALWPKFLPYLLSFAVLGLRWQANVSVRSRGEFVGREYTHWWLLYLFLITCVPFTTMVIGRLANFGPAIWLYAGHTLVIALVSLRLFMITPDVEEGDHARHRIASGVLLAVSSLLAIGLGAIAPHWALWAFMLNFASAPVHWLTDRWTQRRSSAAG
uniref:DUF1211 domain-containing protein n=1 Tax=Rhodopseudomonas palustris (strain BisA53) TaxID=316055 RepID=Q07M98_RHOP5